MIRYLLHTSYIGTYYKGVTQIEPYYYFGDMRNVQGVLERVVQFVFEKKCEVVCSSRTDARVHALSSTFHVDIPQNKVIDTEKMFDKMNMKLRYMGESIQISDIEIVDPKIFEAYRNAVSRSYLYRIAVRKKTLNDTLHRKQNSELLPIEEVDRCHFVESDTFDIEKLKSISELFIGKHDFLTFMRYSKEEKTQVCYYSQRHMLSILVEPSQPCVTTYHLPMCQIYYQFYDIHFKARSFVYRQIRRMVAVMIAAGEGKLSKRDVYEMLTIPSRQLWYDMAKQHSIDLAPAHALYFTGIEYKPIEKMTLNQVDKNARDVRIKPFFLPLEPKESEPVENT